MCGRRVACSQYETKYAPKTSDLLEVGYVKCEEVEVDAAVGLVDEERVGQGGCCW